MIKKVTRHIIYFKTLILIGLLFLWSCSSDDNSTTTEPVTGFLGEIDWSKTVGGSQEDTAQGITKTSDGGYAIVGFTKSIDGDITTHFMEENDYWVAKLDTNGTLLWSKTYGGTQDDRAEAISSTSDGGFVISGYSRSSDVDVSQNAGFYDQWIVKLDASGNIQWEKSFGFSGSDQSFDVIQTSDGGYFTTGFLDVSASGGQGNLNRTSNIGNPEHGVGEFWCHKLDSSGNVVWSRYFGGSNNDRSYSVLETNDNHFLLVGSSESTDFDITNSKGSYDFWAVKVSNSGDLIWQKSYGGSGIEIAYDAVKTNDGNYIIVGDTRSSDGDVSTLKGSADFWVIKINDTDGSLLWERTYGGTDFESARAIIKTQSGDYAITGSSKSDTVDLTLNYGQNDVWVIKINDSGNLLWEKNFGGSQLDFSYGIVESTNEALIVAGNTESSDTDITENKGEKDALIIKIK